MSKANNILTLLIVLGLMAGVIFGQFLFVNTEQPAPGEPHPLNWLKDAGDLVLIRPLMLMIIPLIFVSVVVGVSSLGDPARLGLIGGATVVYYITTMLLAVVLGTFMVTTFEPGVGLAPETTARMIDEGQRVYAARADIAGGVQTAERLGLGGVWMNILHQFIPTNLVAEMAATRPPGVIVFALLLGLAMSAVGERAKPLVQVFDAAFAALMKLILWIIWLTPIGVFLLVAWSVGTIGLGRLSEALGKYMLVVIAGLFIHMFIVLPIVLAMFSRHNPYKFLWQMRRALLTAFGTSSSYATLPVTIETAENEGGCSRRSANFVLPLGSTINMDGTALYSAVAVIFLFQLFGLELQFTELVFVVITATLAAIGAAGIPSAGLVTMVIIIAAVNTSLTGRHESSLPVAAIGIIIGVDRILDMCRTTVNVWGDAVGAKIITRLAPDPPDDPIPS